LALRWTTHDTRPGDGSAGQPVQWRQGRWWRWLAGLEPRARYGTQNSTWFTPRGSQQDGDFIQLTLNQRRAAVAPLVRPWSASKASPVNFLQWELDPKPPRELLVPLLPPTPPEKRQIGLAWRFCSKLGFGSCGLKSGENRPLFIGALVPSHSARRVLTDFILRLIQNRVGWRESKWG
jgi:hypothetical protein